MRELTMSGGGTLRRRIATSCIIEMPAPAVLAVIHRPMGTIDKITRNTMSTEHAADESPEAVRLPCAISLCSSSFLNRPLGQCSCEHNAPTTTRAPSTDTTRTGWPASTKRPSVTTSTRRPSISAAPAGRSAVTATPTCPRAAPTTRVGVLTTVDRISDLPARVRGTILRSATVAAPASQQRAHAPGSLRSGSTRTHTPLRPSRVGRDAAPTPKPGHDRHLGDQQQHAARQQSYDDQHDRDHVRFTATREPSTRTTTTALAARR